MSARPGAAAPADWADAATFRELLELARRFLSGELPRFPGWGAAELDDESDDLRPALLRAAAAGLLPVASQPGEPFAPGHDGHDWGRRAFVGGFVAPEALQGFRDAARAHGLDLLAAAPGEPAPPRWVPAGLRDGVPFLVLGPEARAQELEIFEEAAGPAARRALEPCPFLWLLDPLWGRRDALPAALEALPGPGDLAAPGGPPK